jgi:hypothetical protein
LYFVCMGGPPPASTEFWISCMRIGIRCPGGKFGERCRTVALGFSGAGEDPGGVGLTRWDADSY